MALSKRINTSFGFSVSYWVLNEIRIDREKRMVNMTVLPYVNAAAHASGSAPVLSAKMTVKVADIDYTGTEYEDRTCLHYSEYFSPEALAGKDVYIVAYQYLKQHVKEFKNAKDV